ncbi:MAG: hypothetical protein H6811_06315 [Phycisphaeraceae bacterium]|nr:hypothetical protein [Phycisphaeraceae bacterium]
MKLGRMAAMCVGLLSMAISAVGCSTTPRMGRYTVNVSVDQASWAGVGGVDAVSVDLIALNTQDGEIWSNYPLSAYFGTGDTTRADADKVTFEFTRDNAGAKALAGTDEHWDRWLKRGAQQLFILADLRELRGQDKPGATDPRRLILPLDTRHWPANRTLDVSIQRSGLRLDTAQKPLPEG